MIVCRFGYQLYKKNYLESFVQKSMNVVHGNFDNDMVTYDVLLCKICVTIRYEQE
ncbi:hypothetical protein CHISP_3621 [Chitinispirillum alkaliphilum]|nr:hypothetical protein CHISP_3621 [Chitinispirillum alkaliphilum]